MTLPNNIDKSATRKGEYVGYCNGAQRIRRGGLGWQTYGLASAHGEPIFTSARTLEELGKKLESIAGTDRKFSYRIVE
jgi:hypothetical protein